MYVTSRPPLHLPIKIMSTTMIGASATAASGLGEADVTASPRPTAQHAMRVRMTIKERKASGAGLSPTKKYTIEPKMRGPIKLNGSSATIFAR